MTKKEATAWANRWQLVNQQEIEELRNCSAAVRLKQLATMMQWVQDMNWTAELKSGEDQVRQRWIRLRKAYASI